MIQIAIVDDHRLFRQGLTFILKDEADIQILFEAENGQELLTQLEEHQPQIVLLDLDMPVMDGFATTEALIAQYPELKILILTMHDDEQFMVRLMDTGANGYLLKNANSEEMIRAIQTLATNEYYFNERLSMAMLKQIGKKSKPNKIALAASELTHRELEVLQLICAEQTTTEIADQLCLSPRTIESYRKTLFEKTGVKNMAGLVMWAVRNGFVS